ncbi:MAG: hypothetical protein U0R17_05540 [Acidimicrobiia bacterium]
MSITSIASTLKVSKSSVSIWVRDLDVVVTKSSSNNSKRSPHPHMIARLNEIEDNRKSGIKYFENLSRKEFFVAGIALYAGEGFKTQNSIGMANTDPSIIKFFIKWLRTFYEVEESRIKARLYLHEGLDVDESTKYWSNLTGIPAGQFTKPYRAKADPYRRYSKHEHGCITIRYHCCHTLRKVIGLMQGLLEYSNFPE